MKSNDDNIHTEKIEVASTIDTNDQQMENESNCNNDIIVQVAGIKKSTKIRKQKSSKVLRNRNFLIILFAFLVVVLSITGILLYLKLNNKPIPHLPYYSAEQVDSFNDANKNIFFDVILQDGVDSDINIQSYIIVRDYLNNIVNVDIQKASETYKINPPSGGYIEGATYDIRIDTTIVKFAQKEIENNSKVSFTIKRDDIIDVKVKEAVKEVETQNPVMIDDIDRVVVVDDNGYLAGDIIILDVLMDGFVTKKAYKIDEIISSIDEKQEIKLSIPQTSEIFDELNIKGIFDAEVNEDTVKLRNIVDIEQDIRQSNFLKGLNLAANDYTRLLPYESVVNVPKISINFTFKSNSVVVDIGIEFSLGKPDGDFGKFLFAIKTSKEIGIKAVADVNIWRATFQLGAEVTIKDKTEVKFGWESEMKDTLGNFDNLADKIKTNLENYVENYSQSSNDNEWEVFEQFIPTPVPLLGFKVEAKIVLRNKIQATIKSTSTEEQKIEFGVKRESGGIEFYNNKSSKKSTEFSIEGSFTAKIGFNLGIYASLAGVLDVGFEAELGIYFRIKGVFSIKEFDDLSNFDGIEESKSKTFALYFEVGIYVDIYFVAKVDLVVWKVEAKSKILPIEFAVVSAGYTEQVWLESPESLVLNNASTTSIPDIAIAKKDMFTHKVSREIISGAKLNEYFRFNTGNSLYLNGSEIGVVGDPKQEFKDMLFIWLKPNVFTFTSPKLEDLFKIDQPKRGVIHFELGGLFANAKIDITKEPICIDSIELNFERVVDDKEYEILNPDLTNSETVYHYREDYSNGVKDFQIGRLIRIIPKITPINASYTSLFYTVEKGEEYIVDGKDGIKIEIINGVYYGTFRIINDEIAIGNVDGATNALKEIKITATSNGYKDDYASWNKTSTTKEKIFASNVPVVNYDVAVVVDDIDIKQTAVYAGAYYDLRIDDTTVFPQNATRGYLGSESMSILSENASIISTHLRNGGLVYRIKINENAQVGDQIIVLSKLSGKEQTYFLNVVKKAVESVIIRDDRNGTILPGSRIDIFANINTSDHILPTIKEVLYVVIQGKDIVENLVCENNNAILNISSKAKNNEIIEILAIIDGVRSNTLSIQVDKVSVQNISLSANKENESIVNKGENIQFEAKVTPTNATFGDAIFYIESGNEYATIDSKTGIMSVGFASRGGEEIIVRAIGDDEIVSNAISFTIVTTPVKNIQFVNTNKMETVECGQTIVLDAFVNSDATNQGVEYSLDMGAEFATIDGNHLIINSGLSSDDIIIVKAIATGDSKIFTTKTFMIFATVESISINGRFEKVSMFAGDSATAIVRDKDGNVLDNNIENIKFKLETIFVDESQLAIVSSNGIITILNDIDEYIHFDGLFVRLIVEYDGKTASIIINIIIPPTEIKLVTKQGENSLALKRYETTELQLVVKNKANTAKANDINVDIKGSASAYISTTSIDNQAVYAIIVQVKGQANIGEKIDIIARYIVDGGYTLSDSFEILVVRGVSNVEIENAPTAMNIGESVKLKHLIDIDDKNAMVVFSFVDLIYANRAILEGNVLTINDDTNLVGLSIKILVTVDGVASKEYEIQIKDVVKEISISSDISSEKVQFINNEKSSFYILHPSGKFVIKPHIIGGVSNPNIEYYLQNLRDATGEQYLFLDGDTITVNSRANINSGMNTTLIAIVDGISSEPIVIYVSTQIKTVKDWYALQNDVNGFYVLANNIDFVNKEYIPIPIFAGVIDGGGYALQNIYITQLSKNNNVGLFEENYGTIINLTIKQFNTRIENVNTNGQLVYMGSFVAKNYGHIINSRVVSTGFNMQYTLLLNANMGGIVGFNAGIIKLSSSSVYLNGVGNIGGISGINTTIGKIIDCINWEDISIDKYEEQISVAGIVGYNQGEVENCTNNGRIFDREKWEYVV